MTKRFIVDDDEYIRDNSDFSTYLEMEDICDLLNELNKENEELNQYKILVKSLKEQNQKLKLRLKDLGVEYY